MSVRKLLVKILYFSNSDTPALLGSGCYSYGIRAKALSCRKFKP
ncbi:hypothetical protein Hanom_Chr02g00105861 [Helianthus anomalus]